MGYIKEGMCTYNWAILFYWRNAQLQMGYIIGGMHCYNWATILERSLMIHELDEWRLP